MSKLKIEAVGNGWIVEGEAFGTCVFSATEAKELIEHVKEELSLDDYGAPEQPSEESTETDTSDPVPASLPVEPMADLSGKDAWPGSDTWDHFNSALERAMADTPAE